MYKQINSLFSVIKEKNKYQTITHSASLILLTTREEKNIYILMGSVELFIMLIHPILAKPTLYRTIDRSGSIKQGQLELNPPK